MISRSHRFIFIHVPKTGGNSIQSVLLPLSDDQKIVSLHQDGTDRFEVSGPVTVSKHMTLENYNIVLGGLERFFVFVGARRPFERAVSFYFSPHRWARQNFSGTWEIATPHWDEASFFEMLQGMEPWVNFVKVNGANYEVDDIVRYENLRQDFGRVAQHIGVPQLQLTEHRNKSAGDAKLIADIMKSQALRKIAEDHFAADMTYLNY